MSVCCAGDGSVYARARNGVLLKGSRGRWDVVDLGAFTDDLWSVAWYRGKVYVATLYQVFTLGTSSLEPVDMGAGGPVTCHALTAGADLLWSVGGKDVLSFDGRTWNRID